MTDEKIRELAQRAWHASNGDTMTAVKLLRDWSGLSLVKAAEVIEETRPLAKPTAH